MRLRSLGLGFAMLALVLAVACGGSDKKDGGVLSGGGNTWDVDKGDDLSHAALLVATDLGGSGWTATDDVKDEDNLSKVPACADFSQFKKDAESASLKEAQRSLERDGPTRGDVGVEVKSTINIYKDNKTVSDLLKRYQGVLDSDKFISCFEGQLKDSTSSNAKVTIKKGTPSGSAPNGGSSVALDVDISVGSDSLSARTENYVWAVGNASIQVTVSGSKTSFDAALVKTALAKQQQAIDDALKGSRQRVTQAQAGNATSASSATPTPARGTATPARGTPTPSPTQSTSRTTPTSGSAVGKVTQLEDTSSHRYNVKIDSSGIDMLGMQEVVNGVAPILGGPTPRAGSPISLEFVGAYSKPDKGQVKITINGTSITETTIGSQQWIQVAGMTDGPNKVGPQSVSDLSVVSSMLTGITSDQALLQYLKCNSTDTVNGLQSRVCGFTDKDLSARDLQSFVDGFLQEASANVKVDGKDVSKVTFQLAVSTQGSFPVRFFFEFAGKDSRGRDFSLRMEANITDINKTVDIVAPR